MTTPRRTVFVSLAAMLVMCGAIATTVLLTRQNLHGTMLVGQATIDIPLVVSIDISTAQKSSVNPRIFGVHTSSLFDKTLYNQKNPDVYDATTGLYTPDPRSLALIDQLKLRGFRYPGGTDVRYFHPTDTNGAPAKGYGIRKEDQERDSAAGNGLSFNSFPFPNSLDAYLAYQDSLPFGFNTALGNLVKQNPDKNAQIVVDINIANGTPQEGVETIRQLKAQGLSIAGVEMGNEMYLQKLDVGADPQKYLDMAKPFAQAIKDAYPNMPIGLNAKSPTSKSDGTPNNDFFAWDNLMANAIKTEVYNGAPLYNAYVPHVYQGIICDPTVFTTNERLLECARSKMDIIAHESGINPTVSNPIAVAGVTLPLKSYTVLDEISWHQSVFGAIPMWITEWGVPVAGGDERGNIGGTGFQNTIVIANYILSVLHQYNEFNRTHGGVIKSAFYHNLATPNFITFGVISQKPTNKDVFTDGSTSIEKRRTPWYALKIASPIFNASGMQLVDTTATDESYVHFTTYHDSSGAYYLYISNMSGQEIAVGSLTVDGKDIDRAKTNGSVELVSGGDLAASSGANYFDPTGIADPITYTTTTQKLSELIVPKYAFGYVKFTPVYRTVEVPIEEPDETENDTTDTSTSGSSSSGGGTVIGSSGTVTGSYPVSTPVSGASVATDQSLDAPVKGTITITTIQAQPMTPVSKPSAITPSKPSTSASVPSSKPDSVQPPSAPITITSIDYILDGVKLHTATAFPDTWELNTTTLSNDWHTLSTVYHHADDSTTESIKLFKVENTKTIFEKLKDGTIRIWTTVQQFVQGLL